jgi:rubrerythrin
MAFKTLKEILDRAVQNEDEANRFYSQAANTVKNPSAKVLLNEFAEIELKHKTVLENFDLSAVDEGFIYSGHNDTCNEERTKGISVF